MDSGIQNTHSLNPSAKERFNRRSEVECNELRADRTHAGSRCASRCILFAVLARSVWIVGMAVPAVAAADEWRRSIHHRGHIGGLLRLYEADMRAIERVDEEE